MGIGQIFDFIEDEMRRQERFGVVFGGPARIYELREIWLETKAQRRESTTKGLAAASSERILASQSEATAFRTFDFSSVRPMGSWGLVCVRLPACPFNKVGPDTFFNCVTCRKNDSYMAGSGWQSPR